jgi:tetratricopeptide (TPR) repeat protein
MHYLHQFFTQLSLRRPLLLILEDIQWADTGSLKMIAQVVRRCQHLSILILCTVRPLFVEQDQAWFENLSDYHVIELQPLSRHESEQFSQALLQRVNNVPAMLLEKIVESAGGNPYYVEELVWMLIEDTIIYQDGQQWWVDKGRLEELRIPPTLTGVLQARLDMLSDEERQILQRAAAIGRHFWEATIEHLLEDKENLLAESKAILTRLSHRKLIRPLYTNGNATGRYQKAGFNFLAVQDQADQFSSSWQAYTFQYPLLHEVTYNSILKSDRRHFHRQIADWFLQFNAKEGIETYAAMIARHYDRAGEIKQAGIWYGKAAEFAKKAYAYQEALENYQQALQLMPVETANPERIPLLEGLGMMLVANTRYEEALQTFQIMLAEAEVTGNRAAQSTALTRLGYVYFNMGNHHASLSSSTRAEQIARSLVPVQLVPLARALSRKGPALLYLGHIQESLKVGHEALAIGRQIEDENLVAFILGEIYLSYKALGQHGKAKEYIEQCLEIEEKRGDLAAAARSFNSLGELARLQGDYQKAATYYHRSYLSLDEIGDIAYAKIVLSNLGGVMVATGDYAAALVPLEEVIATIGSRWLALPEAYRFMAEAYLGLDKGPAALDAVQMSMKLGQIQDNPEFTGNAWRVLGKVASQLGYPVPANKQNEDVLYSAEDCFKKSVLIFKQASMERDLAFTYWDWGDYALSQGDNDLAQQNWQLAHKIFVKLDFPLLIEKLAARFADE